MTESRSRRPWAALIFFCACFSLIAVLSWQRGALSSGFGGHNDEAAHAVSGLMIRDYIVQHEPLDPLAFAKDYYLHYPKVAVGQWPPVFHTLLALWTLVFGVSRASMILFPAAITALLVIAIRGSLRREVSGLLAGAAALVFLLVPVVQTFGSMVMTETLLALFCFLAVLGFGRLIDRNRYADGVCFGACAVLAILTKGNGLALALVPPIAIVLSRRWRLLCSRPMWTSAALVLVFCGPWYYLTLEISRGTWGGGVSPSLGYFSRALPHYLGELLANCGWVVGALAGIGLATRLTDREASGMWSAAAAWIVAWFALHLIVPTSIETRHLISLLPAWLMFAAAGAQWVAERLRPEVARIGTVPAAALLIFFGVEAFELPGKRFLGFGEATGWLLAQEWAAHEVLLIESDQIGEGLVVTEVAMRDHRPDHYVLRGTKILSRSNWLGLNYETVCGTPEEMADLLAEIPVAVVLFDRTCERTWSPEHHRMLGRMLDSSPEWTLSRTFDVVRDDQLFESGLEVWEQREVHGGPAADLHFASVSGRGTIDYPW